MRTARPDAPLRFREKLGYGLGDTASNLYLGFWGAFLLYYLTDVFGLSPTAVATMLLVTKVIDAITDPLMGVIADRTRTRWGRYRPYILVTAIPYGIAGYLLFHGPALSQNGKLIYAYVTYTVVMLAYTAINVPYSALMGVISPSEVERTKVTTYRFFCAAAAGMIVAATVTPLKNFLGGGDEVLGFRLTMALFSVLSVILFWITFATTKERVEPIVKTSKVSQELGDLFRTRSWWILVFGGILILSGLIVRGSSIVYFFKYVGGDDGERIFLTFDKTALFLTLGSFGQLVGVLGTPWLSKRMEKAHAILLMSFVFAAMCTISYFVPADRYAVLVALHMVAWWSFGPCIALLFAMYTDVAEGLEWRTGNQVTGLVVAASMFSLKLGNAVGSAIPGYLLDFFGFVPNVDQAPETIRGLRVIFTFVPAGIYLAGGLLFVFYGLNHAKMKEVEAGLKARREATERSEEYDDA